MPKNTLLFYDIETTGLNKCFDQVLQFAAIRTDLELNELSRHEIRIKLNPDVIPSPHAILTHHIGYQAMAQGQNEYEAIQEIHRLLNQPGTLSLGYNTLGFDDEFLRFSFYRNLLPPYTHQYANQCGRLDIYPITVLYYLFKQDALIWPVIDNKVSLKLEQISAKNNLMTGTAHDAMVDVEATLRLAKILKQHTSMWDYAIGYFDKNTDIKRGDRLPIALETDERLFRTGLLVHGKIGAKNNFMTPVLSLGQHHHYKNQTLWLNLDNPDLLTLTVEMIADKTHVTRKKMGESELLLPPQTRYMRCLSTERQELSKKTLQHLIDHPKRLQAICDYHQNYTYPLVPHIDIDAALYTLAFPTKAEEIVFREFHKAKPENKLAIAKRFPNAKRYEQAIRILARHYPEQLAPDDMQMFTEYKNSDAIDFRGNPKMTQKAFLKTLDELQQQALSTAQLELLKQLTAC